jgi:predicted protein tyrosine phosphatase
MLKIRVASLPQAQSKSKDWADAVVSLIDPDLETLSIFGETDHLVVHMHDTQVITDPWSPKIEDVQQVFDFCQSHQNILVHCHGGISRSTAMSIGLLVRDGVSVVDAVNLVHFWSPNMSPNYLILAHVDSILNLSGTLVPAVKQVMATFPQDMMLWCQECQIHFKDEDGHYCPGNHWKP